jgi:hypothetical protein
MEMTVAPPLSKKELPRSAPLKSVNISPISVV